VKTYFISGLGTGASVFDRLQLHPEIEFIHLPWLIPEPKESTEHYAQRMLDGIQYPEQSALVGLSFGGIMSIEINKLAPIHKTVLISSVKTVDEMPALFRAIGWSRLHRIAPIKLIMRDYPAIYYAFGARTKEQRLRVREILNSGHPEVFRWSIDQLLNWKNRTVIPGIRHIHGTNDKIFPHRYVKADYLVPNGPHFMVSSRAAEISEILNQYLLSTEASF